MVALATGTLIRLTSLDGAPSPLFRCERLQGGHVLFGAVAADGSVGGNLRVRQNGIVDTNGFRGPWARFAVEEVEQISEVGSFVRLRSVGHEQASNAAVYLTASDDASGGLSFGSSHEPAAGDTVFCIAAADEDHADACALPPSRPAPPALTLTEDQKAAFVRDGLLVLRGVVGRALVDDALRAINAQLGAGRAAWEADETGKEQLGGLKQSAAVRSLLSESPALGVARQLLGERVRGGGQGQVALRFPLPPAKATTMPPKGEEQWHIDGMKTSNGHTMSPFQLLLGVALSAQPDDDCGNLHAWPGFHGVTFDAVQRQRAMRLQGSCAADGGGGDDEWLGQRPALPADASTQLKLEPGDVVLCHQKLPHRIGLNRSPHVRYQVYFRLSAAEHEPHAPVHSLWEHWGGLRHLQGA